MKPRLRLAIIGNGDQDADSGRHYSARHRARESLRRAMELVPPLVPSAFKFTMINNTV
jgi:hypothetical protein